MALVHIMIRSAQAPGQCMLTIDSIWPKEVTSWSCLPRSALGRTGGGPMGCDCLSLALRGFNPGDTPGNASCSGDPYVWNLDWDSDGPPLKLGDAGFGQHNFAGRDVPAGDILWKVLQIDGPPPPDWQHNDLPAQPENTAVA
jgi:hypothetical protein